MALLSTSFARMKRILSLGLLSTLTLNLSGAAGLSYLLPKVEATGSTYIVTSLTDSGAGSLRQAIQNANSNPGEDTITANLSGTITLSSDLPALTEGVVLDFTQAVQDGANIVIDGAAVNYGLQIQSSNVSVYGMALNNANVGIDISGGVSNIQLGGAHEEANLVTNRNTTNGIQIASASAVTITHAQISNNDIGIYILTGASNININGSGARNAVYGNSSTGIYIEDGDDIAITSSNIGLTASGSPAGNGSSGIQVESAASQVQIGGSSAYERNVISANNDYGIFILADNTTVTGNYIGTSVDGASPIGNGSVGIEIVSSNNQIGGTSAGQGNVIADNTYGIIIFGDSGFTANSNSILGNFIGTDGNGTSAMGNEYSGVKVEGPNASNNRIGREGHGNVISGNGDYGIELAATNGTLIHGNYIGTNSAGTDLHNEAGQIEVGTDTASTQIGYGVSSSKANSFYNGSTGYTIQITDNASDFNTVGRNRFYNLSEHTIDSSVVTMGFIQRQGSSNESVSLPTIVSSRQLGNEIYGRLESEDAGRAQIYADGVWLGSVAITPGDSAEFSFEYTGIGAHLSSYITSVNGSSGSSIGADIIQDSEDSSSSEESSSEEDIGTEVIVEEPTLPEETSPAESIAGEAEEETPASQAGETTESTPIETPEETPSWLEANLGNLLENEETPQAEIIVPEETSNASAATNNEVDLEDSLQAPIWIDASTKDTPLGETIEGVPALILEQELGSDYEDELSRDNDGDGLSNAEEIALGSDPNSQDGDGDTLSDVEELFNTGTDPIFWDTDEDWISDSIDQEPLTYNSPLIRWDSNLTLNDSDLDGLVDRIEVLMGGDITIQDTDSDGLSDGDEFLHYGTQVDRLNKPEEVSRMRVVNIRNGNFVHTGFLYLMGKANPNRLLTFYEIKENGKWIPTLVTKTDEQGRFSGLTSISFTAGEHTLFGVEGDIAEFTDYIRPIHFTAIDPKTSINAKLKEEALRNGKPQIEVWGHENELNILSWKSTIYSQTLITDSQNPSRFASPAKDLENGGHTVAWYSVNLKDNQKNSPEQLAFNLGDAAFIRGNDVENKPLIWGASLVIFGLIGLNLWNKRKKRQALPPQNS